MLDKAKVRRKLRHAEEVISRCVGRNGFYASAQLYRKQYWIRDLTYSLEPLLDSGFSDVVKRHLEYTLQRQKTSGELPERIIQMPPSLIGFALLVKTLLNRNPSLLIRRISTHDSDLLTLISLYRYIEKTRSTGFNIRYAGRLNRIWSHLDTLFVGGLLPEADWRDAMLNYVSKQNFCNQVILMTARRSGGQEEGGGRGQAACKQRILG